MRISCIPSWRRRLAGSAATLDRAESERQRRGGGRLPSCSASAALVFSTRAVSEVDSGRISLAAVREGGPEGLSGWG